MVDGPAASGKGTLVRRWRRIRLCLSRYRLPYRAVGLSLIRAGEYPGDAFAAEVVVENLKVADMDFSDPTLRDEETGRAAGIVAANPAVGSTD